MTGTLRVVAGIILDPSTGQVLRARRKQGLREAGLWEFPGGKIEPGETDAQALQRELREELRVDVVVGDGLCTTTNATKHGNIELVCLWAKLDGARPLGSSDHDILEWCDPILLPVDGWCPPDDDAVRRLRAGLKASF